MSRRQDLLHLPKGSIAIDSASSCNIFGDKDLLSNVKGTKKNMTLCGNGGETCNDKIGIYDGACVWHNPKSIANILSLSFISKERHVVIDTVSEKSIKV